jgi:hypothetical protein
MAINKTTTETKNKIKANSVIALPNRPQIPAEQLKQAFVKPIVDTSNSMIQELDRIVEETNAELEQVQNDLQGQIDVIDDTLQNHKSRIGELEQFAENLETNITEEIEGALENKADLVDGKVSREQLPSFVDDIVEGFYINGQFYSEGEENPEYLITPEFGKLYVEIDTNKMYRALGGTYEEIPSPFELTKAKVEAVLTGDITSHNHATEIGNHNTSETAHAGIRNAVAEAKAIAEGKSRARVFATESALNTWLSNPENVALLQIGDNFYIEETDKPDYWWNGTTIKELETQKVDLTEYAKKTELLTLGTTENDAYRGDLGQIAYNHSQSDHAPSNAQKNSDITKSEIEAKLTGEISSHSHALPTHNHDDRYYTESEVDTKLGGKANTTHTHTKSEITDFPTIPTIPDITVNNGSAESGKYISQIAVDATDKHKLIVTKADLPQGFSGDYNDLTNKPTIPTLSHDISTDIADTTKAVTPNAVGNYTYSRSAIDAMIGDIETLLGGI